MDTNPAPEGNFGPQDGLRRIPRESEPLGRRGQNQMSPEVLVMPSSGATTGWSTIREMARDFGVSIRALRFYEDRGLLHPRREGTARRYSARDRLHLKMILKGKQLGFTLAEIHDILAAREVASPDGRSASEHALAAGFEGADLRDLEFDSTDLEMGLPPEQIMAQIDHLERQRRDLDEAIGALKDAHQRLLESSRRCAAS
ncbi:MerR family transcriptional regulator [Methylocapsa acidiphila]|uniref:MerR family transcriptional regulator n=1 Tax=Methylocapsa acidiphila TaxID=133552 RepID=UPI001FD90B28|nr:MerR family transcriptional regulator [Methylocapsa acidiphila]